MQRQLILFSHGAEVLQHPLNDRCKREAQLFGSWLQQQGFIPDYILSSHAQTALASAEHACSVMGIVANDINVEKRIHKADKKLLINILEECPVDVRRLLLVGDSPLLEKLLHFLSSAKNKAYKPGKMLPESSIAVLEFDTPWSKIKSAKTSILSITYAHKLPKKFPFVSGNNQLEWRDRPAYYYSQSAVIPYRIRKGRAEILLITSSKNKRWIIPKGVIEIGMTAQDSAAKEAYEEAGVRGRVGNVSLGCYAHRKWGATCDVQVYPLEVTEMIPQHERLEPHRRRHWMTPLEASMFLKQKELISMIFHLTEQLMLTGSP